MLNVLEISRYRNRQFKKLFNNDDNIMQKLELIPSLIRMLPDIRDKSQTACDNAAFKKTYKLSENDNVREIFNSISERQSWVGGKETVSGMESQMISTKTLVSEGGYQNMIYIKLLISLVVIVTGNMQFQE